MGNPKLVQQLEPALSDRGVSDETPQVVGSAKKESVLERLIFCGYASMASIHAQRRGIGIDDTDILDRSLEERWPHFMRGIAGIFHALSQGLDESRPIPTLILTLSAPAITDYAAVAEDLKLGRGLRPSSEARAALFAPFFVAVGNSVWAANAS